MSTWNRALDAAGIRDPGLRHDYTGQRALVARFRRNAYVAVRLLLPDPLVPHVVAATAFMHHADNVLDATGPEDGRAAAYAEWEKQVLDGLATGESGHPVIRALLNTVAAHPGLRGHVEEYLATARSDLDFSGFADEADYRRYVDEYSLPAFMLVACLLAPSPEAEPAAYADYRAACRTYIDGSQRLDFVNDLAEDLGDGRLTIPGETLRRHSVTRADLEHARDVPGMRELLRHETAAARRDLVASRGLVGLVAPAHRPFIRALITLEVLTADAAAAKGTGLLHGSARPPVSSALRVLGREYLRARRLR